MELELKHVLPYVEHNVSFIVDMEKFTDGNCKPEMREFKLNINNIELCLRHGKLKLHPLSDLRKEEFNYLYTLLRVHIGKSKRDKLIDEGYGITDLPYFIVEQLFEKHFDIFELIPRGLALDISTL